MTRPPLRDDIALMAGYHSAQIEVETRLNTNEAPEDPPVDAVDRIAAEAHAIAWNRYPDRGARALRARIAEVEGVGGADMVFAANGSNEVLQLLCLAYGGAQRTALTFEPTYALHAHIARICGTDVVALDRRDDFSLDLDAARSAIATHRPSIVLLCSPNNPTGMIERPETIAELLRCSSEVGALLVVDEAYGQFAPQSSIDLVADDAALVVTRTFSKTWSMAAARLGYLIGPRGLVAELESVALPYHLDALTQAAGCIALDYVDEMHARTARLVEERGRVAAALAELAVEQWPSQANFILFRPIPRSGREVWQSLVDRSVLVRDCSSWPRLDGCLRVTLGTPAENDHFLAGLTEALASSGPSSGSPTRADRPADPAPSGATERNPQ